MVKTPQLTRFSLALSGFCTTRLPSIQVKLLHFYELYYFYLPQDKNATFWMDLLPRLASISNPNDQIRPEPDLSLGDTDVYSTMTWLLLATVLLLLVLLAVSWVIARY